MKWQPESTVLIQGIQSSIAQYYTQRMKTAGTNIVAGVGVGWGGEKIQDVPIFDLVEEAIASVGKIEVGLIFVNPYSVLDAALECIFAGIKQIIVITKGVPPLDMIQILRKAQTKGCFVLGSGSQGLIVPSKLWLGIQEPQFYTQGKIGLISRCDRLTDEIALSLSKAGLGQSLAVSLGTDGIMGSSFEQWLQILEEDEETEAIVLVSHPYGSAEIAAAEYIASTIEKPVIVYLPGLSVPYEENFGDALTTIAQQLSHSLGTPTLPERVVAAFKQANITIAGQPREIPELLKMCLSGQNDSFKIS